MAIRWVVDANEPVGGYFVDDNGNRLPPAPKYDPETGTWSGLPPAPTPGPAPTGPSPAPTGPQPSEDPAAQQAYLNSIGLTGYRVIGSRPYEEEYDEPVMIGETPTGRTIKKKRAIPGYREWVVVGPDNTQDMMVVAADPAFRNYTVVVPPKKTGPQAPVQQAPSPLNDWVLADENANPIPPGNPEGKKPKFKIDPRDPTNRIPLPDPEKEPEGSVTTFGNDLVLVKPDGTVTTLRTKPATKETFAVSGIGVVEYDPATGTTRVLPGTTPPREPRTTAAAGVIWTPIEGTTRQQGNEIVDGNLVPIAGLTRDQNEGKPATMYDDPNSEWLVWYDERGQEVGRSKKVGFQPARTQLTPNTVVGELPIYNNSTGRIEWVPNQNQIKASQAVSDLAKSLGLTIGAGSMSEEQAQNLITSAVNTMNARTSALTGQVSAAGETLGAIQQGAQTGAGILQNRVSETSGLIQNLGALPFQGKSPMLNIPSEAAVQGMISGAAGMTTALGGGPGVYEAAANLVQRADPANRLGANAQQAYAGLADATAKFQQLTGRLPPLAQAAAQPMPATGGYTPPVTAGGGTPGPNPKVQPPPGMPPRIVQPKRPQPMAGLGSMTPGAAWNPSLISAGMNWQAQQRGGGMPAPVTININSPT